MDTSIISVELVRELLHYSHDTGIIGWNVDRGTRQLRGKPAGTLRPDGYMVVSINRKKILSHRLAWVHIHGRWPTGQIDHINGDRADNRIVNLRDVDRSGNQQNRRMASSCNASGLLGVSWHKAANKWRATIRVNNKAIHLGRYASADEAHAAYLDAKRRLHPMGTL